MKTYLKVMSLFFAAILLAGLFAGCQGKKAPAAPAQTGGKPSGTVKVLMGASNQATQTIALLKTEFKEMYPDITVEVDLMGSTEIHAKYLTEFASGNSEYDIVNSRHMYKNQLALSKFIVDITPYLDKSTVISRDTYKSSFSKFNVQIDGRWWGLPWRSDAKLFMYNDDLYKQAGIAGPPKTYDELIKVSNKIMAETGKYGIVIPADGRWILQAFTDYITTVDDMAFFNAKMEPVFNHPDKVKAIEVFKELYKVAPKGAVTYDHSMAVTSFIQGEAAQLPMWPFAFSESLDPTKSSIVGKVVIAPAMPAVNQQCVVLTGWNMVMTSFSKNKDAAWLVMEYMSSPKTERQVILNGGDTCPVCVDSGNDAEVVKAFPIVKGILDAMDSEKFYADYDIPEWAACALIIQDYLAKAVSGEMNSQAAMDAAAKDVRQVLADAGYYK